tara:strand:- start:41 stop:685 length:645 start_codon:yes stop_codon:yes gene_type:complete
MNTVIDAVNEFKGKWKYPVGSVGTDAIYFRFNPKCVSYYYYGRDKPYHHEYVCSKGQFNDLVLQMETNFGKCVQSYSDYKFGYHLPPEPTLTYTQAMADNGELPSVGMECKFDTTFFTTATSNRGTCEIIAYYGDKVWINVIDFDCVIKLSVIEFKPLTPPIELIHGEAYNFIDSEDNNTNGIYSEDKHSFTSLSVEWLADQCTNIQPLTVEVK